MDFVLYLTLFFVCISFIETSEDCGNSGVQHGTSGEVASPNYPNNYPPNMDCTWEIQVEPGQKIQIFFLSKFVIMGHVPCGYDYLEIHDGDIPIGKYCGFSPPNTIVSKGNKIKLRMVSDDRSVGEGFKLYWRVFDKTLPSCGAGEVMSGDSGVIVSPSYPEKYDPNLNCTWKIQTSPNKAIQIQFDSFAVMNSIGCRDSYVAIEESGSLLARICGTDRKPQDVTSSGNSVNINFVTDANGRSKGFIIHWKAIDPGTGPKAMSECGGPRDLTESTGVLTSQNFDGITLYKPNSHCQWIIHAPKGKVIRATFEFFDLEKTTLCFCDRVALYDGTSSRSSFIAKYCGAQLPDPVTSSGNTMFVSFESDRFDHGKGFKIKYEIIDPILKCSSNEFTCNDNNCIPASMRCNSVADCNGGEDEVLCDCGVQKITPNIGFRVVGGIEAIPGSWPWQVDVRRRDTGSHHCGGTLIHPQYVISAAHCFKKSPNSYFLVLARHFKRKAGPFDVEAEIESYLIHEKYDRRTHDNDIALVKLQKPVQFNDRIQPACLPGSDVTPPICYVTGWGSTMGTSNPDELKQAAIPIIDRAVCNRREYNDESVTPNMICAGLDFWHGNACHGDSGGPLVCQRNNKWEVHGAVSWGKDCTGFQKPAIYTKVFNYRNWILENMK